MEDGEDYVTEDGLANQRMFLEMLGKVGDEIRHVFERAMQHLQNQAIHPQ